MAGLFSRKTTRSPVSLPFICFAVALSLFAFSALDRTEAATVKELETGLRDCQASWDRLNQRILKECPYAPTRNETCDQIKDYMDKKKKERATRLNTPMPSFVTPERLMEGIKKQISQLSERLLYCENYGLSCRSEREEMDNLKDQLEDLQAGRNPITDPKSRAIKQLDELIAKKEREYAACLESSKKRDECFRLEGQLKSVVRSCDEIKQNLAGAKASQQQASQQQKLPLETVKIFVSGKLPNQVGKQATYQGRVESDAWSGNALYGYYWYLNGQVRTKGYNQTTFTFTIPQKGLNKVMLRVVKTKDNGKTWQNVGEASDSFYTEEKSNPFAQADQTGKVRTRKPCKYADNSASSCAQYSRDAIAQNNENLSLGCGYDKTNSIRFHGKEADHSGWCKTIGKQQGAVSECNAREDMLDTCISGKGRR